MPSWRLMQRAWYYQNFNVVSFDARMVAACMNSSSSTGMHFKKYETRSYRP